MPFSHWAERKRIPMSKFHHSNAALRPLPLWQAAGGSCSSHCFPVRSWLLCGLPQAPAPLIILILIRQNGCPPPDKGLLSHLSPGSPDRQPPTKGPQDPCLFLSCSHFPSSSFSCSCSSFSTQLSNYPKPLQLLHAYSCTEHHMVGFHGLCQGAHVQWHRDPCLTPIC